MIVKENFDDLQFTESNISGFQFSGNDLMVDIHSGLEIYGNHPLSETHKTSDPCRLIFKNVVSSKRILDIYAGDPKTDGFKESQTIIDETPISQKTENSYEDYLVEGVLYEPKSWLTWFITAESFYLDNLKD
jgi:hypothetical protein